MSGCISPVYLKDLEQYVPCGDCPACRSRRASSWSFRLLQEERHSISSYFITLTYDCENINITDKRYATLCKRDMQLFFKKVRIAHSRNSDRRRGIRGVRGEGGLRRDTRIKYYCVGEYGGRSHRPHYHVLVFNTELEVMFNRTDRKILEFSNFDGRKNVYCKQWDKGYVSVGRVTGASVGYCLKYMCKEKKNRIPLHKNDDRLKEFAIMSKGLGLGYLTKGMVHWHKQDLVNRVYVNIEGGKKASMSRYYKDKMYSKEEREKIAEFGKLRFQSSTEKVPTHRDWLNKRAAVKAAYDRMTFNNLKKQVL